MPRLFTGLQIPEAVAGQLALFRGGLPGAKWVEPGDLHITLRFLGDVDNALAEDFHDLLRASAPPGPLDVALEGLASFGGDKPRSIHVAVAQGPALTALQEEHERLARRAGAEPERRRFTPHVTLAWLARSTGPEAVARYLTESGLFPRIGFTATRCVLYSARESRGGGPYRIEAAYPLEAGGA